MLVRSKFFNFSGVYNNKQEVTHIFYLGENGGKPTMYIHSPELLQTSKMGQNKTKYTFWTWTPIYVLNLFYENLSVEFPDQ